MRTPTAQRDRNRGFDLLVQSQIDPTWSLAIDAAWRRTIAEPERGYRPALRIYDFGGDILSLGRFHTLPTTPPGPPGVGIHRRHSGGRCLPFGHGFLGLSLLLPHRSALESDDPFSLNPAQVLNRCVRGILSGLKSIGLPAFYAGRDWVTIDRRVVGMISLDISADGGLLFDAVLATSRDFGPLTTASGEWPVELTGRMSHLEADAVTSLKRELGVELNVAEVGEVLARGYAEQFGTSFVERQAPPDDLMKSIHERASGEFERERWLADRRVQPHLDHYSSSPALLGVFETHFALGAGRALSEVLLAGDIIANPAAIEAVESRLRGCPADYVSIDTIVSQVFESPENFILGLSSTQAVAATICAGLTDAPRATFS